MPLLILISGGFTHSLPIYWYAPPTYEFQYSLSLLSSHAVSSCPVLYVGHSAILLCALISSAPLRPLGPIPSSVLSYDSIPLASAQISIRSRSFPLPSSPLMALRPASYPSMLSPPWDTTRNQPLAFRHKSPPARRWSTTVPRHVFDVTAWAATGQHVSYDGTLVDSTIE